MAPQYSPARTFMAFIAGSAGRYAELSHFSWLDIRGFLHAHNFYPFLCSSLRDCYPAARVSSEKSHFFARLPNEVFAGAGSRTHDSFVMRESIWLTPQCSRLLRLHWCIIAFFDIIMLSHCMCVKETTHGHNMFNCCIFQLTLCTIIDKEKLSSQAIINKYSTNSRSEDRYIGQQLKMVTDQSPIVDW